MAENESFGDLLEAIYETGEVFYRYYWDSGAPGPGAEYEYIYYYQGRYYPVLSYDDMLKPFDTLDEALVASELLKVTDACVDIYAPTIPVDQLIKKLVYLGEGERDRSITINGVKCIMSKDRKFQLI
jgi:hypothetical protein